MTAQPTDRISTPQFGPQGAPQPGWAAPQQPGYGTPQAPPAQRPYPQSYGPGYPPPFTPPPAPPAAPKRSTGKIAGIVVAAIVLLGGLGVGALLLFGTRTVEPESVQKEIVRITQAAVQVAPADVRCPEEIEAKAGGTFVCTATVDGQPVTYNVRQNDDQGNLTITYDRLIKVTELESTVAGQVGADVDVAVEVTCEPANRTVVVNAPGTPISCTAVNATDPTDDAKITVTVAADGTPSYTFA